MNSSYNEYVKKVETYEKLAEEQKKSIEAIGYLRLFTFIIGFGVTGYIFTIKNYVLSIIIFIVTLMIFIYLIMAHSKESKKRKYTIALKEINEKSLKRIDGGWRNFKDDGIEYKDENHAYSGDLDIFGRNSLFQWINSSKTFIGRIKLKNRLINPLKSASDIKRTQQSISELAEDLNWRQQFEAEGMVNSNDCVNLDELYIWAENRNELYNKPWLIVLVRVIPVITLILIILSCFTHSVNYRIPTCMLIIQFFILFIGSDKRTSAFNTICKYRNNIDTYSGMIELIEKKEFSSHYLEELKSNLISSEEKNAAISIKKLSKICDKIYERKNAYFLIINILLLWDYQCMIEFEQWRIRWGKDIKKYLEAVGEFESLNSISNIIYDNPTWAMPLVFDDTFRIKADSLGHPLLGKERVCNSIIIEKQKDILLITGSNMSGKSTFLRTVGINLVLSYLGAPVCAKYFECPIMEIYTCMRLSDNLENSISSFYAEILRIKAIVQRVKENKKVFFLLDELFKGTNSIDRHAGAKALIKQLGEKGAAGLVSTHDLELCDLKNEYPKIKNYHFQEFYIDNELKFDYKIHEGAATTRNGLYLIKLAGIDLLTEEER